ncbi:unnamed protein product [Allacma fusca]|uniref:Uncharacterized protein n=1 Tax=Allacma fusca TaxID=39272 RepID=A0A8J2LAX9_9HEXA|nr:unnamed protein product [Allacma fusca]
MQERCRKIEHNVVVVVENTSCRRLIGMRASHTYSDGITLSFNSWRLITHLATRGTLCNLRVTLTKINIRVIDARSYFKDLRKQIFAPLKMTSFHRRSGLLYALLSVAIFFELLPMSNTLLCYNCLRLDCEESDSVPPKLCNDVRDFITQELRNLYYIDLTLPKCPNPKDSLSWKIMQIGTTACSYSIRREYATCALSRIQILTELDDDVRMTLYGTVMGCANVNLLNAIKTNIEVNRSMKCALVGTNVTSAKKGLKFSYEVETCHIRTDYCTKDFCIDPLQSIVRPFKPTRRDNSFDAGVVIGIIALVLVIVIALILASLCRTPMSWASNTYRVSDQQVNIVSEEATFKV